MPPAEKRKTLRRAISYPAYIDLGNGSPPRECTLCDASQEGAQLMVAEPDIVPDQFILALSSDGAARRKCRVAWRSETQIGVEFVREKKVQRSSVSAALRHLLPKATEAIETATEIEAADRVDINSLSQR